MDTLTHSQAAEQFLRGIDAPDINVSLRKGRYSAWTYWPHGDVLKDRGCYGHGDTLDEAVGKMTAEVEKAKTEQRPLKTAAECKAAVLDLIREHDAAPASFRDAVDGLRVAS